MNTKDLYTRIKKTCQDKKKRQIVEAISGISPYRMKKALKSQSDFEDLKFSEIARIEAILDTYGD